MDYNKYLSERQGELVKPHKIVFKILSRQVDEDGNDVMVEVIPSAPVPIDCDDLALDVLLKSGVNINTTSSVNTSATTTRQSKEIIAQDFLRSLDLSKIDVPAPKVE